MPSQLGHWRLYRLQSLVLFLYKCQLIILSIVSLQVTRADYLSGRTALHFAALNGHARCIRLVVADFVPSAPFQGLTTQIEADSGNGDSVRTKNDQRCMLQFDILPVFFYARDPLN